MTENSSENWLRQVSTSAAEGTPDVFVTGL